MKNIFSDVVTNNLRNVLLLLMAGVCMQKAYSQPNNSYQPPVFTDSLRMQKIESTFPIIDSIFYTYAMQHHYPGFTYGLVVDGRLVHAGAFGYTDVEKKMPATVQSLFRIASMTKSFTAMAILKLREEGKLQLDAPHPNTFQR
jgi:CubicO group peptidase (beta-lactamase class C family)